MKIKQITTSTEGDQTIEEKLEVLKNKINELVREHNQDA